MYKFLDFLFIHEQTIITVINGHIDRDIILTPNRTQQYAGKILYFSPIDIDTDMAQQKTVKVKENQTTTNDPSQFTIAAPWEQPLKHAIYLVLNNKVDDGNFNSR